MDGTTESQIVFGFTQEIIDTTLTGMRTGRPPKQTSDIKSSYVRIRVTLSERAEIKRRAKAAKAETVSDWMRERLLGDQ